MKIRTIFRSTYGNEIRKNYLKKIKFEQQKRCLVSGVIGRQLNVQKPVGKRLKQNRENVELKVTKTD